MFRMEFFFVDRKLIWIIMSLYCYRYRFCMDILCCYRYGLFAKIIMSLRCISVEMIFYLNILIYLKSRIFV